MAPDSIEIKEQDKIYSMGADDGLRSALYDAIRIDAYDVLGLDRRPALRTVLGPILRPLLYRFVDILTSFEEEVERMGFNRALAGRLPRFVQEPEATGLENIPAEGSLLLASNHPAAYDAFIIASLLPRDDLKIVATDIDLIRHLPATEEHFLFIGKASAPDDFRRMSAIRESIRHLKNGGALLLFPGGLVDPDPALSREAAAALQRWQPGIEILMKKVPETKVVLTIVSGVLAERWLNSPVTRLRKEAHNRQKVAEIFQVIEQLLLPGRLRLFPKLSFAQAITYEAFQQDQQSQDLLLYLIQKAQELLAEHWSRFYPG